MFSKLIDTYSVEKLEQNGFISDQWFVGSALMGHDFRRMEEGIFYYYQETIWTKVLDLSSINPYWEIYNRTYNFLLIDKPTSLNINFLLDALACIENYLSKELQFVFITANPSATKLLHDKNYDVVEEDIPFFIEKELVGSYLKVFAAINQSFYPLADCTIFSTNGKRYFEVNVNNYYLEYLNLAANGIIPDKFKKFDNIFNRDISNNLLNFIDIQENIRLVSLYDCLVKLSDNNVLLGGNYRGHTAKKLLKKFVLYSELLNFDLDQACSTLIPDYATFIEKEITKLKVDYPKLIDKYSREILRDRYGVSDLIYEYLSGYITTQKVNHQLESVKYFTDVPFISEPLTYQQFRKVISQIMIRKKLIKHD